MQHDVVALALVTAASWGASEPIAKLGLDRGGTPIQVAIVIPVVSLVTYWSAILLRGETVLGHPAWVFGLFAITGVLATAFARAINYTGTQRLGASINSAALNTRPLWAGLLAVLFLGEVVTAQMGVGIVVVVVGLVALALSGGGNITGWRFRDLAFPLVAALTFGGGNVARRFAFEATTVTALEGVAINETAGLLGLVLYVYARTNGDVRSALAAPRSAYAYFVGCGLLNALALFTLFEALNRGQVIVVDPISSPTSLFAILFTFLFLRQIERVTRRLLVGAALIVSGVLLITGPQVIVF